MATEIEKQESLKKMENFFKLDMEIKQGLINIAPNEMDGYSEEYIIEYSDKMFKEFQQMESQILQIINMYEFGEGIDKLIQRKLQTIREALVNRGYSFNNLKELYRECFSDMSKQLIEETQNACKGYFLARNTLLHNTISHCKTINEILHVLHSYIVNNEQILQSLPQIGQKTRTFIIDTWDEYGQEKKVEMQDTYTAMYGVENEVAQEIYDCIEPGKVKMMGKSCIVALQDKVLMMVRDHGHALTLEINTEQEQLLVKYFIPKICNAEMVNRLKGVAKVTEGDNSTTGIFECSRGDIRSEIIGFIEKVPTDDDIPEFTYEDFVKLVKNQQGLVGDAQERNEAAEAIKNAYIAKEQIEDKGIK